MLARARRRTTHTATTLLFVLASPALAVEPVGTTDAREAVARCYDADRLPESTRGEALAHGLVIAERAVATAPDDPVAHFAAFCLRGKRVELEGVSWGVFSETRKVRASIDRALTLAPDWPTALAAKGAMLMTLPRLFGGDAAEGERLLRRAIALDPTSDSARDTLAELLGEQPRTPQRTADADG